MKLIVAIIRPFKLDAVRAALVELGVGGLTVGEARGCGGERGRSDIRRGAGFAANFHPKIKLEVAVPGERVERAVEAIRLAATTGRIGDGKIFILDMAQAVRIRTGETQAAAL